MAARHISAQKAWDRLSERAEHGETFGFIACLGVVYKAGVITRAQVLDALNAAHVTREDLRKFSEFRVQSRPTCNLGDEYIRRGN